MVQPRKPEGVRKSDEIFNYYVRKCNEEKVRTKRAKVPDEKGEDAWLDRTPRFVIGDREANYAI